MSRSDKIVILDVPVIRSCDTCMFQWEESKPTHRLNIKNAWYRNLLTYNFYEPPCLLPRQVPWRNDQLSIASSHQSTEAMMKCFSTKPPTSPPETTRAIMTKTNKQEEEEEQQQLLLLSLPLPLPLPLPLLLLLLQLWKNRQPKPNNPKYDSKMTKRSGKEQSCLPLRWFCGTSRWTSSLGEWWRYPTGGRACCSKIGCG